MYPDDINELNYQFDFVFISRTFDAVLNQGEFLKYVFQKLKNDGKLCLEIFTSTEKKEEIFTDKLTRPNGHLLQYPNEFTIKKLLEEAGFMKIEIIEKNIQDKKQRCVIFTTKGNSTPVARASERPFRYPTLGGGGGDARTTRARPSVRLTEQRTPEGTGKRGSF